MFTHKRTYEPSPELMEGINEALSRLSMYKDSPKEFAQAVKDIDALYDLAYPDLKKEPHKRIDPNAIIAAGASILGIVVVLQYEHAHVIASKAFGMIVKPKI